MLIIHDEDVRGNKIHTLRFPNEKSEMTVREIIQFRIENEISRFNIQRPLCFFTLVKPAEAEITDKGYRMNEHHEQDYQAHLDAAINAFEKKNFILNVNNRDLQSLDDVIKLSVDSEISFIKFMEIIV